MIRINEDKDLRAKIADLLDDNKIEYSFRGRTMITVRRDDLARASELARTIDKDGEIGIASPAPKGKYI